jgi:hypothetical protein
VGERVNDEQLQTLIGEGRRCRYFQIDDGAEYELTVGVDPWFVPCLVVTGMRTSVQYRSAANAVEVTGKVRYHGRLGDGRRSVLLLDTGEGVQRFPGVLIGPTDPP